MLNRQLVACSHWQCKMSYLPPFQCSTSYAVPYQVFRLFFIISKLPILNDKNNILHAIRALDFNLHLWQYA